jgi:hypothetical protein
LLEEYSLGVRQISSGTAIKVSFLDKAGSHYCLDVSNLLVDGFLRQFPIVK